MPTVPHALIVFLVFCLFHQSESSFVFYPDSDDDEEVADRNNSFGAPKVRSRALTPFATPHTLPTPVF